MRNDVTMEMLMQPNIKCNKQIKGVKEGLICEQARVLAIDSWFEWRHFTEPVLLELFDERIVSRIAIFIVTI